MSRKQSGSSSTLPPKPSSANLLPPKPLVTSSSSSQLLEEKSSIKICVIGNPKCGKTSFILSYKEDDRELPHTTLDETIVKTMYQGKELSLFIYDTNGSDDYDRYRTKLAYPNTDVFIICYSIVSRQQFENVKLKWVPEVKMLCPNARIVLCATKTDLRDDHRYISSGLVIDRHESKKLAEECSAVYTECSVYDQGAGVKEVFDKSIALVLSSLQPEKKKKK